MAITLTFLGIQTSAASGIVATTGTPPAVQGSQKNDQTNAELILDFIGTLSGSYTAGGEPLDFTSAAPSGYQLPSAPPADVHITELAVIGTAAPGFSYLYAYGPTLAAPTERGGAIQIFGAGAGSGQGGTEISGTYAGTTPSLSNKQLKIRAFFSKV